MPTDPAPVDDRPPWWRDAVIYQVYLRSFGDSDGDGSGDLRGVMDHLEHLEWLGVDGVWLSPVTRSPNADWGYDVSDFTVVSEDLGSLADLDDLVAAAASRSIRVLLDLVPNHTSVEHPWFVDSRSSRSSAHRDWYVWADGRGDGSPPNNWVSSFGGPAWTFDEETGQFYLHNHLPEQPDLNWWSEDVRRAFDDVMTYWLDRGIAGFRIDVCNIIVKDRLLRDNPPATERDSFTEQMFGQRWLYNGGRPELHDVLQRWRKIADSYPGAVLIGETPVEDIDVLAGFYGQGTDELHLAFNFPFIDAPLEAEAMKGIVASVERAVPRQAWPAWTGSNHDLSRQATRWAGGDVEKVKVALTVLLTLRGTPVLYQGDEIGMEDVEVPQRRLRDPLGVRYWPAYVGRDPMRTPMPWRNTAGGGFTDPGVEPWLPFGDLAASTVEDQRDDPRSVLRLVRDLLSLRKGCDDLTGGDYRLLGSAEGTWAWERGERAVVLANLTDRDCTFTGVSGSLSLCTDRARDGERLRGTCRLGGWQAAICLRDTPGGQG